MKRSVPGKTGQRRQYKQVGKVAKRRQGHFVSAGAAGFFAHRACPGLRFPVALLPRTTFLTQAKESKQWLFGNTS